MIKIKSFNDIKIGDVGEDYIGQKGIVKAKGTLTQLRSWFTRGQCSYEDALQCLEDMEIELNSENDQFVAVLPLDEEESFDSPKGSNYVYYYDGTGFVVLH